MMADKEKLTPAGIAFTLPISCQICLGKVKHPVLCPNQHVFCSPCMDVWLERNQQCPSCRTPITEQQPCKKILGGLCHHEEDPADSFSKNKDLRRSRIELLYKDYEDEMERLQSEVDMIRHERNLLEHQVKKQQENKGHDDNSDKTKGGADVNMLMMLTKKLQDATSLYETVKKDIDKLKKENSNLKDENINLGRENQRLRMDLANRSPRKFGRFTVATLETKLDQYEKEMKQLQKALEHSDSYIENVEKELADYRQKLQQQHTCVRCKAALYVQTMHETEQVRQGKVNDTSESGTQSAGDCNKVGTSQEKEDLNKLMPPPEDPSTPSKAAVGVRKTASVDTSRGMLRGVSSSSSSVGKDDWRLVEEQTDDNSYIKSKSGIPYGGVDCKAKEKPIESGNRDSYKPKQEHISTAGKPEIVENKNLSSVLSFYGKRPVTVESKKATFSYAGKDMEKIQDSENKDDDISFELEAPSPPKHGASTLKSIRHLSLEPSGDSDTLEVNASLMSASSMESCKKRLKFEGDISGLSLPSSFNSPQKPEKAKQVTFIDGVDLKTRSKNDSIFGDSLLDVTLPSDSGTEPLVDSNQKSKDGSYGMQEEDPDTSMSVDIMDCMKLFDGAEKRLGQLRAEPAAGPSRLQNGFDGVANSKTNRDSSVNVQVPSSGGVGTTVVTSAAAAAAEASAAADQSYLDFVRHTTAGIPSNRSELTLPSSKPSAASYGPFCTSSGETHSTVAPPIGGGRSVQDIHSWTTAVSSHTANTNVLAQSHPSTQDSTSTLQGMIQRVSSLETNSKRSSSAPPATIPDWKSTHFFAQVPSGFEQNNLGNRQRSGSQSFPGRLGDPARQSIASYPDVPGLSQSSMIGLHGSLSQSARPGHWNGPWQSYDLPGLQAGLPHSSMPGLQAGQSHSSMPGLQAGQSHLSMAGLQAGQSQSSMPGLQAGLSHSSMPGLQAGRSHSSVPGLQAGRSHSSMPGLQAGQSHSSVPGLQAGRSHLSMPGLQAGQSHLSMPGLQAGLSHSSVPGLQAGQSHLSMAGLQAGQSHSSMPGLQAGQSQPSMSGLQAGQSQPSMSGFPGGMPQSSVLGSFNAHSQPMTSEFSYGSGGSSQVMSDLGWGFTQ